MIQGDLEGASLIEVLVDGDELSFRPAGVETSDDALLIH